MPELDQRRKTEEDWRWASNKDLAAELIEMADEEREFRGSVYSEWVLRGAAGRLMEIYEPGDD